LELERGGYGYIPLADGDKDKTRISLELGMTMKIWINFYLGD